jgi:transposase-like protein
LGTNRIARGKMTLFTAECEACHSIIRIHPDMPDGSTVEIRNHTVTTPCPHCGGRLVLEDGDYIVNSYKCFKKGGPQPDQNELLYGDYVRKLSREFESELDRIEAVHNFEVGEEFEKAICKVLRKVLPTNFGVCRGYLVDAKGNTEGDDVIIYDRIRYPRLRPTDDTDTETKQRIPIEAAYAYIEAKNTLTLIGDDGQSLSKALKQVNSVKAICSTRETVPLNAITRLVTINSDTVQVTAEPGGPQIRNPFYTAIFARFVRLKKSSERLEADKVGSAMADNVQQMPVSFEQGPDLMVLGSGVTCLPMFVKDNSNLEYVSPFAVEGSTGRPLVTPGISFGIALCSLLFALDHIELGRINWSSVMGDAITSAR